MRLLRSDHALGYSVNQYLASTAPGSGDQWRLGIGGLCPWYVLALSRSPSRRSGLYIKQCPGAVHDTGSVAFSRGAQTRAPRSPLQHPHRAGVPDVGAPLHSVSRQASSARHGRGRGWRIRSSKSLDSSRGKSCIEMAGCNGSRYAPDKARMGKRSTRCG